MYRLLLYNLIQGTEFENYTIAPFKFIYISRKDTGTPVVWEVLDKMNTLSFTGWTTSSGYKYKGINELIMEYLYYTTNSTTVDYEVYKNLMD